MQLVLLAYLLSTSYSATATIKNTEISKKRMLTDFHHFELNIPYLLADSVVSSLCEECASHDRKLDHATADTWMTTKTK